MLENPQANIYHASHVGLCLFCGSNTKGSVGGSRFLHPRWSSGADGGFKMMHVFDPVGVVGVVGVCFRTSNELPCCSLKCFKRALLRNFPHWAGKPKEIFRSKQFYLSHWNRHLGIKSMGFQQIDSWWVDFSTRPRMFTHTRRMSTLNKWFFPPNLQIWRQNEWCYLLKKAWMLVLVVGGQAISEQSVTSCRKYPTFLGGTWWHTSQRLTLPKFSGSHIAGLSWTPTPQQSSQVYSASYSWSFRGCWTQQKWGWTHGKCQNLEVSWKKEVPPVLIHF